MDRDKINLVLIKYGREMWRTVDTVWQLKHQIFAPAGGALEQDQIEPLRTDAAIGTISNIIWAGDITISTGATGGKIRQPIFFRYWQWLSQLTWLAAHVPVVDSRASFVDWFCCGSYNSYTFWSGSDIVPQKIDGSSDCQILRLASPSRSDWWYLWYH
jgi:hypothetical protein